MCVRVSLLGRSAEPLDHLGTVLLHALALNISEAQVELRYRIALLGCSAVPFDRLGVVLLHLTFVLVSQPV